MILPSVTHHPANAGSVPHGHEDPSVARLGSAGYVETELLLRGDAAGAPYVTRALLRHPSDPGAFSGVVFVEPMHWAGGRPVWRAARRHLMREGHAWAEIASQATASRHLRTFDGRRYADVRIVDAAGDDPDAARIGIPAGGRTVDDVRRESDAFRELWRRASVQSPEIIAQFARALRTGLTPLATPSHLFLAGLSQSGGAVRSFAAEHHARLSADDPIVDGYLLLSSGGDAVGELDVPIVELLGESEFEQLRNRFLLPGQVRGLSHRRADSSRYRLYEVAGMAHTDTRDDPAPRPPARVRDGHRWSRFPNAHLVHVACDALVRWARDGATPPPGRLLDLDTTGRIARDADGNALGGVRSPHLDIPLAHVEAIAGPGPEWACGSERPFGLDALRHRYGTEVAYRRAVGARIADLVTEGYYLRDDAVDYLERASWTD